MRLAGFNDSWFPTILSTVSSYRKIHRTSTKKNYVSTENILQNYQGIERFTSDESVSGDGFDRDDILMGNIRPYLKKVCLADFDGVCNADVLVFKSESVNPHFLHCILANDSFINYVMSSVKGSKMPRGDKGHIMQYPLSIPSAEEQRKIAYFISLLNERIYTQNKIIEDLQSQKAWICQHYFMQRKAESYGWTKTPLTEVLTERKTYATKGNEYPHATLAKEGIYAKSERYDRDFLVKNEDKAYKITHINDICYNPANLKFGVICRNTFGSAIFSPIYITFEANSKFNPCFVGYYLTNNDFINRIRKYEEGTIYERMAVSPEDFLRGEIYIPSIEEQNKVVSVIQKLEEKIENELSILGKLKEQKKYLLSNMFI